MKPSMVLTENCSSCASTKAQFSRSLYASGACPRALVHNGRAWPRQRPCSAVLRTSYASVLSTSSGRRPRRSAVVCLAAAKNFYDQLGVSPSASDRDIKSAYRKLAMKLHPDVNKAPDAQKRFMEVKVAYETLSDAKQRAEYDRRLRMGGFSSAGSRPGGGYSTGSSSSGFGGAYGSSSGWGGSYGSGPNFTQEPVPGLDDLIRDLEKEFTAYVNQRSKDSKGKTLLEELEDLGGEFLDFLEESLGIKDEQPAGSSPSSGSQPRDTRSAAERFDAYWQQYGEGKTGSNSSSPSGSAAGSRAASTGRSESKASSYSSPKPPPSSSGTQSQTAKKSNEDDIEAELLALKKKLNKL